MRVSQQKLIVFTLSADDGQRPEDFDSLVTNLLEEGWQPLGPPTPTVITVPSGAGPQRQTEIVQAFVRYEI